MLADSTRCYMEDCLNPVLYLCECMNPGTLMCEEHLDDHKRSARDHKVIDFFYKLMDSEKKSLDHYRMLLKLVFLHENSLNLFLQKEQLYHSTSDVSVSDRGANQPGINELAQKNLIETKAMMHSLENNIKFYYKNLSYFKDFINKGIPYREQENDLTNAMVKAKKDRIPIDNTYIRKELSILGFTFPADAIDRLEYFYQNKRIACEIASLYKKQKFQESEYARSSKVEEFSVYKFDEGIDSEHVDVLIALITESRANPDFSVAAANVITLLNTLGVGFKGRDLSGVVIPGANLSNGCFAGVNFEGADLSDVNFTSALLINANLEQANLERVIFGVAGVVDDTNAVTCVKFIPKSNNMIIGNASGHVSLASTTKILQRLYKHETKIQAISISSKKRLASLCKSGKVRCYDLVKMAEIIAVDFSACPKMGHIRSLAFSPLGDFLMLGTTDGQIYRHKLTATDTQAYNLRSIHQGKVNAIAYSPDGSFIVTASGDHRAVVLESDMDPKNIELIEHTGDLLAVTIAKKEEETLIATAGYDSAICVWLMVDEEDDSQTAELKLRIEGHSLQVTSLAFSPDALFLYSASNDLSVNKWCMNTGRLLTSFRGHTGDVREISVSNDGSLLAACTSDWRVHLWNTEGRTAESRSSVIMAVAVSPDEKTVATGTNNKEIALWDLEFGGKVKNFYGHLDSISSLKFSANGEVLYSAGWDGKILVWDINKGNKTLCIDKELLKRPIGPIDCFTLSKSSPDNPEGAEFLAFAGSTGEIISFNVWNKNVAFINNDHKARVIALVSLGNDWVSASFDRKLRLIRNGKVTNTSREEHRDVIWGLSLSPNEEHLCSVAYDGHIKIWNTDLKMQKSIDSSDSMLTNCAFTEDSRFVIAAAGKTLKVVDLETYEIVFSWQPSSANIISLDVVGKCVVIASWNCNAKLCLTENLCNKIPRIEWSTPTGLYAIGATSDTAVMDDHTREVMMVLEETHL